MFVTTRLLGSGLVLWLVGTAAIGVGGHPFLPPDHPIMALVLLIGGAAGSAWLVRHPCAGAQLSREDWMRGAVAIVLPTLCLDALSASFFPAVFPNIAPTAAGFFGGWMLAC